MIVPSNSMSNEIKSVPLLDVVRGNQPLKAEIMEAFSQIYDSGRFVGGPYCQSLEQSVAHLCETQFAVGCASGSDALLLALMAIDIGTGAEPIRFVEREGAALGRQFGAREIGGVLDGGHPLFGTLPCRGVVGQNLDWPG